MREVSKDAWEGWPNRILGMIPGSRMISSSRHSFLAAMLVVLSAMAHAGKQQGTSSAEETVARYFQHLQAGEIEPMDTLFFKIPVMEAQKEDWRKLLDRVSQMVHDDQLAWEVLCGKELTETAAVIVNQTMKYGKPHGDPDAIYLVKKDNAWLLLPDIFAPSAKEEVEQTMSQAQVADRHKLKRWAVGEIRGLTHDCSDR